MTDAVVPEPTMPPVMIVILVVTVSVVLAATVYVWASGLSEHDREVNPGDYYHPEPVQITECEYGLNRTTCWIRECYFCRPIVARSCS